ncbi:hypothetical protein WJX81_002838 [Elliptochloris bilobata]|uniref:Uncharacterized protein n=1 Tax=Elliptochloris bilobata TaxID=381761 RepID=A0AAW1RVM6_9CHLO
MTFVFARVCNSFLASEAECTADIREEAAAIIDTGWLSMVTYTYCCVTLVGVFMDLEEPECAALNAVCAFLYAGSLLALVAAGAMPRPVTAAAVAGTAAAAVALPARACGALGATGGGVGKRAWAAWNNGLALLGAGMLSQALGALAGMSAATAPATVLVGIALAAGYGGWFLPYARWQRLWRRRWARTVARALPWSDVPAWMATVLFMVQPALQLAAGSAGAGAGTAGAVTLCAAANAAVVPRALATRDHIFFTGTASCAALYCAQLATLAATGTHGAALPALCGLATLALVAWLGAAASVDARCRGFPHALDSVLHTLHLKGA